MDQVLRSQLLDILQNDSSSSTLMSEFTFRYEITVPKEVHWVLVEAAAHNQMHHEEFVEQILTEFALIQLRRLEDTLENYSHEEDEEEDTDDSLESINAKLELLSKSTRKLTETITEGMNNINKLLTV